VKEVRRWRINDAEGDEYSTMVAAFIAIISKAIEVTTCDVMQTV
jgi:hypothetical protein